MTHAHACLPFLPFYTFVACPFDVLWQQAAASSSSAFPLPPHVTSFSFMHVAGLGCLCFNRTNFLLSYCCFYLYPTPLEQACSSLQLNFSLSFPLSLYPLTSLIPCLLSILLPPHPISPSSLLLLCCSVSLCLPTFVAPTHLDMIMCLYGTRF